MLTMIDKDKILKLRSQGFSYQAIHEELGFAVDTIMKVCKNEEGRKIIEVEESQTQGEGVLHNSSTIVKTQEIISSIDDIIKEGNLKAREKVEWIKRKGQLEKMLKEEVDDKIAETRADAVEKINIEWQKFIKQNYVKKEIVTGLNNKINEMETTNSNLRKIINEKEKQLTKKQSEIFQLVADKQWMRGTLMNQINNLSWENDDFRYENSRLNNTFKNYDYTIGRQQETHKLKTGLFEVEKTIFNQDTEAKQLEFNKLSHKIEKKIEAVETREKKVSVREDVVNDKIKRTNDDRKQLNMEKADIEKTREQERIRSQRLQKWQTLLEKTGGFNKFALPCKYCKTSVFFDATDPETHQKLSRIFGNYIHAECIKKKKQMFVTLHPVSFSGTPIMQSGFSPVIQSGEVAVVSSGTPVMQSGFSI